MAGRGVASELHMITSPPFFQKCVKNRDFRCVLHPAPPPGAGCKTRLESRINVLGAKHVSNPEFKSLAALMYDSQGEASQTNTGLVAPLGKARGIVSRLRRGTPPLCKRPKRKAGYVPHYVVPLLAVVPRYVVSAIVVVRIYVVSLLAVVPRYVASAIVVVRIYVVPLLAVVTRYVVSASVVVRIYVVSLLAVVPRYVVAVIVVVPICVVPLLVVVPRYVVAAIVVVPIYVVSRAVLLLVM